MCSGPYTQTYNITRAAKGHALATLEALPSHHCMGSEDRPTLRSRSVQGPCSGSMAQRHTTHEACVRKSSRDGQKKADPISQHPLHQAHITRRARGTPRPARSGAHCPCTEKKIPATTEQNSKTTNRAPRCAVRAWRSPLCSPRAKFKCCAGSLQRLNTGSPRRLGAERRGKTTRSDKRR